MGAVEQTSETDDLLSEDVIDSQVSSRERDTAEGSERSLAIWLFMTGAIALASSATLVFERLRFSWMRGIPRSATSTPFLTAAP